MFALIARKRKDKNGGSHSLFSLTRKNQNIVAEILSQKRLVKSGKQETYNLQPFELYINRFAEIAKICNAITVPPSEHEYNFAMQIGKEVSNKSGVDFITCFQATGKKRRHISQKLESYNRTSFEPKLKPKHLTILLIDDIIYTGRTFSETTKILEGLGNFVIPIAITYT